MIQSLIDMPVCDEQCDAAASANSLGFLLPTAQTALHQPELRSLDELQDYNEFIYNLHWRIRDFSLHRRSYDFESLARKAWGKPIGKYGLKIQDKDISVAGVPLYKTEEDVWRSLASITQERLRASNWLIGFDSENFYEVATDT